MVRKRQLTFNEVCERVLVAMSQMGATLVRLDAIRKQADVKVKEAEEALKHLKIQGQVDHWPIVKGWKITVKGLEAAAYAQTRTTAASPWQWRRNSHVDQSSR